MMLFFRYFCGAASGAAIDLSVAFLTRLAGAPLPLSSLVGFCVGAGLTYCIHLRWTFKLADKSLFSARFIKFWCFALLTPVIRISVIQLLLLFSPPQTRLVDFCILGASIGTSFVCNYLLSRFFVFNGK